MVYGSAWAPVVQIWVLAATNSTGLSVCLFVRMLCNAEEEQKQDGLSGELFEGPTNVSTDLTQFL